MRWCKGVANVGFVERNIAKALFATPPVSSFEEALQNYLKADEIDPNFKRNMFEIGQTYLLLKNNAEAKKWFQKLAAMPSGSEADKVLIQQASDQFKKL